MDYQPTGRPDVTQATVPTLSTARSRDIQCIVLYDADAAVVVVVMAWGEHVKSRQTYPHSVDKVTEKSARSSFDQVQDSRPFPIQQAVHHRFRFL